MLSQEHKNVLADVSSAIAGDTRGLDRCTVADIILTSGFLRMHTDDETEAMFRTLIDEHGYANVLAAASFHVLVH